MDTNDAFDLAYLLAAALFILGLNGLTSPGTARRGNSMAMAGMIIAITATLLQPQVTHYGLIVAGIITGGVIGVSVAMKIQMAAMPQLVAALHSFVGLAAVLVAIGTHLNYASAGSLGTVLAVELFIGTFIGAITFTGSVIAFANLQAILSGQPIQLPARHWINIVLLLIIIILGVDYASNYRLESLIFMTLLGMALGVLLIIPIGGADMPVVISMLNSYSGWAAAATGFTLQNKLLIITGALVGFSGAILSYIMCKAMNRGFLGVILGGLGDSDDAEESPLALAINQGIKSAAVEDVVYMMESADKVIIVPGYGMAVAQAQHALKELLSALNNKGIDVKFAIHPVAGRMPGHMNVLLAEADIPYEVVFELEEINPEFSSTDIVLVVGANDVTNPAAKRLKSSPIYGMPILETEKAQQIFVIKRGMNPGYSGIDNLLYYQDNCSLVFGDAKEVCSALATAFNA